MMYDRFVNWLTCFLFLFYGGHAFGQDYDLKNEDLEPLKFLILKKEVNESAGGIDSEWSSHLLRKSFEILSLGRQDFKAIVIYHNDRFTILEITYELKSSGLDRIHINKEKISHHDPKFSQILQQELLELLSRVFREQMTSGNFENAVHIVKALYKKPDVVVFEKETENEFLDFLSLDRYSQLKHKINKVEILYDDFHYEFLYVENKNRGDPTYILVSVEYDGNFTINEYIIQRE
jgi:hypothetical protein